MCWPPSPFTEHRPELAAAGRLEAAIATLDELATADRVLAIGETGLDYFRTGDEGKGSTALQLPRAHPSGKEA